MNGADEEVLAETIPEQPKPFQCGQCGAELTFAPGLFSLKCGYCGHENPIAQSAADIQELDFHTYLAEAGSRQETEERRTLKCQACGAESTVAPHVAAHKCPFCDSTINAVALTRQVIKPKSLLPFHITGAEAKVKYRQWLQGLWFAPGALKHRKHRADIEAGIAGIYLPFWTYDANTLCWYTGQQGTHYYVTETRQVRNAQGKMVSSRVQVRKTRWRMAMGRVWNNFDDVLIPASRSMPESLARALEPWDLANLVPYTGEYLSGFRAESYQVDLEMGFESAKAVMDAGIKASIRRDIGGDEQRILTTKTQHDKVTFKHVLLPVWLSAYRYHGKAYRFMVNARTGEVQGERPWSVPKIASAVVAGLIALGTALYFLKDFQ